MAFITHCCIVNAIRNAKKNKTQNQNIMFTVQEWKQSKRLKEVERNEEKEESDRRSRESIRSIFASFIQR